MSTTFLTAPTKIYHRLGKTKKLITCRLCREMMFLFFVFLSFVVFQKLQSHPTVMLFALIALEKFAQTSRYSDFLH